MAHYAFGSQQGMDHAAAASLSAVPPSVAEAESARRHQEEENAAIRLVHLLVTCAHAIQAGDYAAAAGNLAEARSALATTVSTVAGIGRVTSQFAAALAQRLFPASPSNYGSASSSADHAADLYRQFYDAGPYLKFAHFTANQAILEAFEGCDRVHVVDLDIMQGVQWPALIQTLSLRPGDPPALRITGVGRPPAADGSRYDLNEVGVRLAEFARAVNVPFSFRGVPCDTLDALQPWMLQLFPGEALAVNSVCQLHLPPVAHRRRPRLDRRHAAQGVHGRRAGGGPQQAGAGGAVHQRALLLRHRVRLHGGDVRSHHRRPRSGGVPAAGDLRHRVPLSLWHARLRRAGLAQTPLGPSAVRQSATLLRAFSGAGYGVQEREGCLTLAWHDRPLFTASAWHAARTTIAADTGVVDSQNCGSESSGHQHQAALAGIAMQ